MERGGVGHAEAGQHMGARLPLQLSSLVPGARRGPAYLRSTRFIPGPGARTHLLCGGADLMAASSQPPIMSIIPTCSGVRVGVKGRRGRGRGKLPGAVRRQPQKERRCNR